MKTSAIFLTWLTLGSCLILTSADSSESCTHYAAIGQRYELPLTLKREKRLRWLHNSSEKYDSKHSSKSTLSVTDQWSLILPKVTTSDSGGYKAEVSNENGEANTKTLVLCVLESVQKPSVTVKCDNKGNKVQFTCSVPVNKDITYQWLEGGKTIANEKSSNLVLTPKQVGSNSFTCNVSNPASSQSSDPVQQNCFKSTSPTSPNSTNPEEEDKLFGLDFWLMVGILAGGGGKTSGIVGESYGCTMYFGGAATFFEMSRDLWRGEPTHRLVLILIVATIACCTINRRKRRLQVKEEQELRLQWSTTSPQQHHYTNQRGHAHSHGHAHSSDRSPGQATMNQGPAAAGHTGPRPPRSRQNRPRPPDPITGQPLPGPRRQVQTGTTQVPTIGNDEENPPPLPQPRKKAPRT